MIVLKPVAAVVGVAIGVALMATCLTAGYGLALWLEYQHKRAVKR